MSKNRNQARGNKRRKSNTSLQSVSKRNVNFSAIITREQYESLSKSQQKEYAKYKGYSYSDYNTTSEFTQKLFPPPKKAPKKKNPPSYYRLEKIEWLKDKGYSDPMSMFRLKDIDSLRLRDIRKDTYSPSDVPFLQDVLTMKKVPFEKDAFLLIAYFSYSGNTSFEDIIAQEHRKSNRELIKKANDLLTKPCTYSKSMNIGSSGRDGECMLVQSTADDLLDTKYNAEVLDNMSKDKHRKYLDKHPKRKHKGDNVGWQFLSSDGNNPYLTEVTARQLLEIYCAVADWVNERDRAAANVYFYDLFEDNFPTVLPLLPNKKRIVK